MRVAIAFGRDLFLLLFFMLLLIGAGERPQGLDDNSPTVEQHKDNGDWISTHVVEHEGIGGSQVHYFFLNPPRSDIAILPTNRTISLHNLIHTF